MFCKHAEIKRTGEEDSSGYQTAVITLFDKDNKAIFSRWIDSFQVLDRVCCDFEGSGDIKIWPYDDNSVLDIDDTYGPRIKVVNL